MTSVRKAMKGVVALAAVALLLGARAEAATISVVPGSQTIAVGANASVDIVVSESTKKLAPDPDAPREQKFGLRSIFRYFSVRHQ